MMAPVEPLVADELTIAPHVSDGVLELRWTGRSISRQPARVILPYLKTCLDAAAEGGLTLRLHFERMQHVNSSTMLALVQVVHEARRRPTRLVFVYDAC